MLTLGKDAEKDIREAYSWYESQRQYLGASFLSEIESTLKKIQENPQLYACAHKSIRRALCKRFPYAVYYIETKSNIIVLAILQQRRKPTEWQKRK
jgi:plasmid stabilization system protein ParE